MRWLTKTKFFYNEVATYSNYYYYSIMYTQGLKMAHGLYNNNNNYNTAVHTHTCEH